MTGGGGPLGIFLAPLLVGSAAMAPMVGVPLDTVVAEVSLPLVVFIWAVLVAVAAKKPCTILVLLWGAVASQVDHVHLGGHGAHGGHFVVVKDDS